MDEGIPIVPSRRKLLLIVWIFFEPWIGKGNWHTEMKDKGSLLRAIGELENEIKEVGKRIPPHSAGYEIIQLLEEKERELKRKNDLLKSMRE